MAFYEYVVFVDGVPTAVILASPKFKHEIAGRLLRKEGWPWPTIRDKMVCKPRGQVSQQHYALAALATRTRPARAH